MRRSDGWISRLKDEYRFAKRVWQSFNEDRLMLVAAGIAFYITLSMIPLILLLISVAAFFVNEQQIQALGESLITSFGAGLGDAIREQVLSVVENRGVLTGISVAFGLWAGSQIFLITEMALNQVWDVKQQRSFWVRRGLALLMVIVTGVLLLIAVALRYLVGILGDLSIPLLGYEVSEIPWLLAFLLNFLLPWLLASTAFSIAYRFLTARRVRWKTVLPGAIVAGFLWTLTLQAYSWYVANFGNYNVLYGSLGGLILLMIWFNYSAVILLLGAEISSVIREQKTES